MGSIFAVRTTFGITPPLYSENLQRVPTLKPGELVESIFAAEQPSQISTLQVQRCTAALYGVVLHL